MTIVIVSWPEDPERGIEPYGPFIDEQAALVWIRECEELASLGWRLLQGAHYLVTGVAVPFDPADFMQDAYHG